MTPLSRKFKALLLAERVALFVTLGSAIVAMYLKCRGY